MKERFKVSGMTCAACVAHVDKAVRGVDGVKDVSVNLLTNSMDVEFDSFDRIKDINRAVSAAGYKSRLNKSSDSDEKNNDDEFVGMIKRLIPSIILVVPLFYFSMGHMLGWYIGYFHNHLISLGIMLMIISGIIIIINKKFFISGFKSLMHKSPNMDTLVALGSGVAFIYSVVMLFMMCNNPSNHDNVMRYSMNISFETAGMVPSLIMIGKTLEAYSKGKTTSALKKLINLSPKKAHVLRDNSEIDINPSDMIIGDIFIVKPGEAIPVDGIVLDGVSSVNEQALTGEAMPVDKLNDSKVYSATINIDGTIKCKATSVGGDTTLSKIIKMVEDAGASKAPIAKIADKVSGVFVPIIMSIAIIVFICWMIFGKSFVSKMDDEMLITYAMERAIAVLVIACPCALGLATPVAIMVGNGKAANNGILFKNAEALEKCGNASYVVLDKTGTITLGDPSISNIIPLGITSDEFLKIAVSLERNSSHPLAKAICKNYSNDIYEVEEFKNTTGVGVYAKLNGKTLYGVNKKAALEQLSLTEKEISIGDNEAKLGRTPMYFIYNNKLIGIISVSDTIKPDSKKAIEEFKELGIIPIMLTGDNYVSAKAIADEVGLDYVVSDVHPDEKLAVIEKLQRYGSVAMVGDGINDSPALTKADIGIAIGAGSDIAIDAADVVLVKSNLRDAVAAFRMSRRTLLNIKENLFWAFFYNIIMIPIAAGVFSFAGLYKMKPWYGAAAMSLSSVCVVLNALRLNLFNPYKSSHKRPMIDCDMESILQEEDMKEKLILEVEGMMCEKCQKHVEEASLKVEGVISAKANLKKKNVVIKYDGAVDVDAIKSNIKEAGYEVK